MVRCGVLVGLFLLSVFSPAAWAQIGNLRDIINFLQAKGRSHNLFKSASGTPLQHFQLFIICTQTSSAMVLSGTLSVVLLCLLSLCLRGTEAVDVNQNNLARIISHIQREYNPGGQYAVAINVPAQYCNATFSMQDFKNVLKNDEPDNVKNVMKGDSKVYNGNRLIGATPLPDTKSPVNPETGKHPNFHSEYLLLIKSTPLSTDPNPNDPLMKKLLNTDLQGCVIFYIYTSPCKGTCLNENNNRNILTALNMIRDYNGPKAFVYNKIFKNDNTDLENYLRKIEGNNNIGKFLFRCYRANNLYTCQLCFSGGSAAKECLDPNL